MNPDALATLLALGAAYSLPTKLGVDLIRKQVPTLPPWALLMFAFLIGQALVWLTAVYTGTAITPQQAAGLFLSGLGAMAGAVSATEMHKSARIGEPHPEYDQQQLVLDAAAEVKRMMERDYNEWVPQSVDEDDGPMRDSVSPPSPPPAVTDINVEPFTWNRSI